MDEIELRVTPEVLGQKADEVTDLAQTIRSHAARISSISRRTRTYWQGGAGERNRAGYRRRLDLVSAELDRLDRQVVQLLNMAHIYRSAEKRTEETVAALKSDIIGEAWLL